MQLSEANNILDSPETFFKVNMLPSGCKKKLESYQNERFRKVGEFRIIRRYINVNNILLKADEICMNGSRPFYEIGFDASDVNVAKEKIKKIFNEMELKYNLENVSKYNRFIKSTQKKI